MHSTIRRITLFAVALLAVLLSASAQAADCSLIETRTAGGFTVTDFFLLDSDTADATGVLCDLATFGQPHEVRWSVRAAAGCTKFSASVEGFDLAGGISRRLGVVDMRNGQTRISGLEVPRFVRAVSRDLAGCTDFDVVGSLFYENATTTVNASTSCDELIWATMNPTEAGATDDFLDFLDHAGSTTENNEDNFLVDQTRRAHQVACRVDVAPGAGDIYLVTLNQGVAGSLTNTTLTCTVSGTDTTGTSTGFVDITATNVISAQIDTSTGAGDPAAAALIAVSLCLGN